MRGLWPLLIPTFMAGFGAAWWLKPEPPPVEIEVQRPKVMPRVPGAESGLREVVVTEKSLLDALAELDSEEEIDRQLRSLDPDEIPALLGEMAPRAGYLGLDPRDEDVLGRLLIRWYEHDPEGALMWTLTLGSAQDRRELLRGLIDHEAGRDFERALKLAIHYRAESGGAILLPDSLVGKAAESGADALVELCRASRTTDGMTTFGHILEYPADFDFPKALNGLADLGESLARGERLSAVPGNLLEEWAKRDPQAAYSWLEMGREAPMNDTFESFAHGYAQVATPAELGRFAAGILAAAPSETKGYQEVFGVLAEAPALEFLDGLLASNPDPAAREQVLTRLFERAGSGMDENDRRACEILLRTMPPALRMRLLGTSRMAAGERARLIPLLRSLGHGEEEIAAMTGPGG